MKKWIVFVVFCCAISVNAFADDGDAASAAIPEPKVYVILAMQEKMNSLYHSAVDAYERAVYYIKTKYGK